MIRSPIADISCDRHAVVIVCSSEDERSVMQSSSSVVRRKIARENSHHLASSFTLHRPAQHPVAIVASLHRCIVSLSYASAGIASFTSSRRHLRHCHHHHHPPAPLSLTPLCTPS
eukprot:3599039-Rhodomonas_salina.1